MFNIIDSEFELKFSKGAIITNNYISSTPIAYVQINDDGSVFTASASYNEVFCNRDWEGDDFNEDMGNQVTIARTEIVFQPTFSGVGPTINFTHGGSTYDESQVYIYDNGVRILDNDGQGSGYFEDDAESFNKKIWNAETGHISYSLVEILCQQLNAKMTYSRENNKGISITF